MVSGATRLDRFREFRPPTEVWWKLFGKAWVPVELLGIMTFHSDAAKCTVRIAPKGGQGEMIVPASEVYVR